MYKFLIKLKLIFIKFFKWINFLSKNYNESIPIYSNNNGNGLKIHLGSGEVNLQGWVNIDARKFKHTHLVSNGFQLDKFKDSSVSEVYFCHVLEHFSFKDSEELLNRIYKILEPGGVIRVSVPDIKKLIDIYIEQKKIDTIKRAVMGGQNYENDFHKSIYDYNELKRILEKNNFKNVETWNTMDFFGQSIEDWSDGYYKINGRKIKISLNVVAKK